MPKLLRHIILFGAPVFVGIINLTHPVVSASTNMYRAVLPHVGWWITLHVLNLGGFALLGLAAYLLIQDERGIAATISKVAIAIFVPFYVGFDALIGIGTGTLIQYASNLPLNQLTVVVLAINALWTSGVGTLLATIGSMAWSISMLTAAIALTEPSRRRVVAVLAVIAFSVVGWGVTTSSAGTLLWWVAVIAAGLAVLSVGRSRLPVALLVLAGMLFGMTHVVPIGPLGMACFALAAVCLEFSARKTNVAAENRVVQAGVAEQR